MNKLLNMSIIKSFWIKHENVIQDFIENEIELNSGTICKIATNKITGNKLFVIRLSNDIDNNKFVKKEFRGVSIELLSYPEYKEITFILLDNDLEEIYYLFIENIFESIKDLSNEDLIVKQTLNSILKWKKLFDKIKSNLLSEEQQKGLVGELLFIKESTEQGVSIDVIIGNWYGPDFYNKDFVIMENGFEIKATTKERPSIKISSEQQLDQQDLKSLYLIQYILEVKRSNGFTLPDLVNQIRVLATTDFKMKEIFEDKLIKIGYNENDSGKYDIKYDLVEKCVYEVRDDFPKITKSMLPKGVYDSEYNIEVLVLEKFKINNQNNFKLIYG